MRLARAELFEKTEEQRPYSVALASAIASASSRTLQMTITGPNVSSRRMRMSGVTSTSTVGAKYWPVPVSAPLVISLNVCSLCAERMPPVIFVTAHDRYALRAFELAAVDYLMKPFDDARFDQAASRAHELIRLRTTDELRTQLVHLLAATDVPHAPARFIERIAVRERKEIRIVAVSEIDYIAASGPYAEIHVAGEALLHRERMQSLEEVLDPARFCRIHRSAIVNLARVAAIEPQPSGDSSLRLCSGAVLRVSRARLAELTTRLGITT